MAICCVGLLFPLSAKSSALSEIVKLEAHAAKGYVQPGQALRLIITATIQEGFHINSNLPASEFLIPTALRFNEIPCFQIGPVQYPAPKLVVLPFLPRKASVFDGSVSFLAECTVAEGVTSGEASISGALSFQACDGKSCMMPASISFQIPFQIVAANGSTDLTGQVSSCLMPQSSLTPAPSTSNVDEQKAMSLMDRGLIYSIIAFFLAGLGLNLTPCVYPVIPITVGYFSNQSHHRKSRVLALACYYIIGIALVFAVLGLLSGLAGKQWGFVFQSPWAMILISLIILCMAASMFGAFEVSIPSAIMDRFGKARQGAPGAFVMGATAGLIIAPCGAGLVIGLIGLVAKMGIAATGALLFFAMGLGLGLPFLLLASFSGMLHHLPKSGMWTEWIRDLFGVLLIGVAFHFLVPQAAYFNPQEHLYMGVLALFGGLLLGFLEHNEAYGKSFRIFRAIVGVLVICWGVATLVNSAQMKPKGVEWISYSDKAMTRLTQEGRPMMIDLYADWCSACKQLDQQTFTDAHVLAKSAAFSMVRADCTRPDSETSALRKRFNVAGLPTIVFLSPDGSEIQELRVTGFIEPSKMVEQMNNALSKAIQGDH